MRVAWPSAVWSRAARDPLAVAFAISLLGHAVIYGAYKVLPDSFLKSAGPLSRLLERLLVPPSTERKRADQLKQWLNQKLFEEMLRRQAPLPMTFLEVDPALASEPPKESRYYSTHSTTAANPDPQKEAQDPKIHGKETRTPRLFDNPKPQPKTTPQPLQPAVFPKEPEPPPQPKTPSEPARPLEKIADRTHERAMDAPDLKPPGGQTVGDVALAKPKEADLSNKVAGAGSPLTANPLITDPSPPSPRERPRTLAQAYQQNPMLAGQTMQQEGGVRRRGHVSIDVQGSPFGAYDAAFIAAVQERWYQLLEKNSYMLDRRGKVVLDFHLRFDGRINEMKVNENSVGDLLGLLCQRAVLDPAPYARWPGDMRRMVGLEYRDVRFTFYYD